MKILSPITENEDIANKKYVDDNIPIDFFNEGIAIPRDADLNDYITVGKYYSSTNSIASSLINSPTNNNFCLFVIRRTAYISQIIMDTNGQIYTRHRSSSGWALSWVAVVNDVQINSSSVMTDGIVNLITNTAYNASTNKIATMTDIANAITTALNTAV